MKIVEFLIDDTSETGVKTISLVDQPAMQSDFISFKTEKHKPNYIALVKDGEKYKQIVAGLSMIPDKMIYRIDPETGEEYNGYFSQDTIEKIRNKYHKEMQTSNVNLDHDENQYIDAYLVESYILSSQERVDEVTAQGIEGAVLGAWYTQFKIEDEEIFQKVLDGEFNGFSIEAYLNKEIKASQKNNLKEKEKKMKKNLIERFKDFLVTLEAEDEQIEATQDKFEDALVPEQGFTLTWGEVGAEVTKTYTNDAGEEVTEPVGQGEFTLEDGKVIVVDEASMLIEVREAAPEEEADEKPVDAAEEKSGDSTVSYTEVGAPVTVDGEAAPEGDITLDSGVVLVVDADGNLAEIKEAPEEEAKTPVEVPAEEDTPAPAATSDLDKSLNELLDLTKNGDYSVMVTVQDGAVTYGAISSWTEIRMSEEVDKEVEALKAKITELEEKLSEPIAEPQLTDSTITSGEAKVLTVYEAIAKRKGIQTV